MVDVVLQRLATSLVVLPDVNGTGGLVQARLRAHRVSFLVQTVVVLETLHAEHESAQPVSLDESFDYALTGPAAHPLFEERAQQPSMPLVFDLSLDLLVSPPERSVLLEHA